MISSFALSQYDQLDAELKTIIQEEENVIIQSDKCIDKILPYISVLKNALAAGFTDQAEEIEFFKYIKPRFFSRLIYHVNILKIESKRPTGSHKTQVKYLSKELDKLKTYFDDNSDFYQYYRIGSTHLDDKYFVRNQVNVRLHTDPHVFDYDTNFSTSHDFKMSMILANEMLRGFLNSALIELEQLKFSISKVQEAPKKKLIWTAPKTALIELAYGLQASGAFNNSNADVRQIATYLQSVFNVDLGNYYRTFQEIRIRKSGRTNFIDEMRKKLIRRMDESDENPKEFKSNL
jgi:hypothetical protein